MGEQITNQEDYLLYLKERALVTKLREAVGFCKDLLEINANMDKKL